MLKAAIALAAGLLAGSSAMADTSVTDLFRDYAAVTSGNLDAPANGIEGNAYIQGNLTGGNTNFGQNRTNTELYVGGQTSIRDIHMWTGTAYLNDADGVSTNIEKQGDLSVYVNGAFSGRDNSRVVRANQGDLSGKVPAIDFNAVSSYSQYLAGLSGADYNRKDFNVLNNAVQSEGMGWDASKVTVYNTSFTELQSSNGNFSTNLKAGGGETLIINVAGTSGTFTLNPNSGTSIAGQVIWNFYEATDINLDRAMAGAVLAPKATVSGFSGWATGSVIAENIRLNNGGIRGASFAGGLPSMVTNVPEIGAEGAVGALALVLGGIAVMTGRRRVPA